MNYKLYDEIFVYKIIVDNEVYIGSTNRYCDRITEHKSRCYNDNNQFHNLLLYRTIRDKYGSNWEKVKFFILDVYYNVSHTFKRQIEQIYMDELKSTLNMMNSYSSLEEHIRKKYVYRISNRQKIYQKFNCNCGGTYTYSHKSQHQKTNKHREYIETV